MKATTRTTAALVIVTLAILTSHPRIQAQPTELFFSEYVEGTSNNKALEIYNGTDIPIDLAAGGYNVQMFFNGSTSSGLSITLTGTVPAGGVFVLAHGSASAEILAVANQTNSAGWFNGDDVVMLRRGATVIDVIGQIGLDPGTEWGSGLTSTADNTLRRKPTVTSGDTNSLDPFDPSVEWVGFATDTFDGLGFPPTSDDEPSVVSTIPANGDMAVLPTANISVTFSEPVDVSANAFGLSCTSSGAVSWQVTGGPTTFTLNPAVDLISGETCTLTVAANEVSDQDETDPPDTMAADAVTTFSVAADPCSLPFTRIPAIQGSGSSAAITGPVSTMGVVVGDYEGPSGTLRGFYIQDPEGDGDPATSDALFVFNGDNDQVALGDLVRVTGNAAEFQDQTQISASSIVSCGTGNVTPVDVTLPVSSAADLERFEAMLVRLPQTLYVTEHFQLGRFGEVLLSSGGVLPQPTDVASPGVAAQAVAAANVLNQILLDDASQMQNVDPIVFGRAGMPLSAQNTLRAGDTVTGAIGVMTYTWAGNAASGNAYRVRPVNALGGTAMFAPSNPRPEAAPEVGGTLRVASANLLNYYNTFAGCTAGITGDPLACRGAEDEQEFERQRAKTVAALLATGADILGVTELENDGYGPDSAIADLTQRLNDATAPGTWAFIDADASTGQVDALGSDGIKVALLYKPAVVTPVGQTAVINTGAFGLFELADGRIQQRNRPSLAQSLATATGARVTIVVNHLISKGASCELNLSPVGPDDDTSDGQGKCNLTRVAAMEELLEWLQTDPTGVADPDYLLLGDFNAYTKEDPLAVLQSAGFSNLVPAFATVPTHTYAFDGQWGSLDHALASSTLLGQVTGAAPYHINADEPGVLDFNTNFKPAAQLVTLYAPDEFRAGDHDPVVIGLDLNAGPVVSAGGPYVVIQGQSVLLQATGHDPDGGVVTFEWDLDGDGTFETPGMDVLFTATSTIGSVVVKVRATDADGLTAIAPATVNVIFNWSGFFPPIANGAAVNVARAGSAVPVKFSLNGDQGSDVFAPGFPVSLAIDCSTGEAAAGVETTTAGGSTLTYDQASGQYVYVWKTDKTWGGTCRRLVIQLVDGTVHEAMFRFR